MKSKQDERKPLSNDQIDALLESRWQRVRELQALEDPIFAEPADPDMRFILERVRDVSVDAFASAVDEAMDALLVTTDIPLSPFLRRSVTKEARDPERRKRNEDRALAAAIAANLDLVTRVLGDAGVSNPTTRAAEYLADHWREVERRDGKRPRFNSGRALREWLRCQGRN
jgi:hypothetical protein